jgi:hypothetical protein
MKVAGNLSLSFFRLKCRSFLNSHDVQPIRDFLFHGFRTCPFARTLTDVTLVRYDLQSISVLVDEFKMSCNRRALQQRQQLQIHSPRFCPFIGSSNVMSSSKTRCHLHTAKIPLPVAYRLGTANSTPTIF